MKKVSASKVVATAAAIESPLPPQIQEALGELVGAAREGLLALSVGVGLGVVHELMELEVNDVVGPKGKWNPAKPSETIHANPANLRRLSPAFADIRGS